LIHRLRKPGEVLLEMSGDASEAEKKLAALEGVNQVKYLDERADWTSFSITTDPNFDVREDVAALMQSENWKIRELASRAASLEDAFVDLVEEKQGLGKSGESTGE